ncbi:unnamed protein product [Linum trigynum]|uniref:Uncharacterized protein n=1 Tax=Linum trigynum TaxID=586398 RepID=A0AAV2CHA2_9ROSI
MLEGCPPRTRCRYPESNKGSSIASPVVPRIAPTEQSPVADSFSGSRLRPKPTKGCRPGCVANEKFLKVSDLIFNLGRMVLNTFPYSIQELRNPYFHCNIN